MKKSASLTVLAAAALSLTALSCSEPPSTAGATSETTNGIVVSAVSSSGFAISNAQVFLEKADALRDPGSADHAPKTLTNAAGTFTVDSLDTVDYVIEVIDSLGNHGMGKLVYSSSDKRHHLDGKMQLQVLPTGRLFGTVHMLPGQKVYVQVFGLHRITTADSTGFFSFKDLPAGMVTIKVKTDTGTVAEDSFTVEPQKSTDAGTYTIGASDSAIIRYILDLNGLQSKTVESVVQEKKDGRITYLNFDKCGLDTLPPEIGKLRLTELSLGFNNLKSLPEELFDLTQLDYLDISGNKLTQLSESVSRLQSCTTLDIGDNELTTLPKSIIQMNNVETVFLNNNRLYNLPGYIKEWINAHAADDSWEFKQKNSPSGEQSEK